jgi:replicative DNA helicase
VSTKILRSVIDFGDGRISKDSANVNYLCLIDSELVWPREDDKRLLGFIRDFNNQNLEVPTARTIRDYFEKKNDIEVGLRLDDIAPAEVYTHAQFAHLLSEAVRQQKEMTFRAALKTAAEIVGHGIVVQEGREKTTLQGIDAAYEYVAKAAGELTTVSGARTRGDVRDDPPEAWKEYQEAERSGGKNWGAATGINEIDKVCHGCKRGELWIHAAFTGELKTTFALNVAYNLVTRYRTNVVYVSMEMPYEQLRRNIYAIHSASKRWNGRAPLDYRKIRDGELSPEDKAFYEEVLTDFERNPEYCRLKVWAPDKNVTIDGIRTEVERYHREMDVGFLVLDHGGLIESSRKHKEYTIELNAVLRDAKKALALRFNRGEGVPVFMLFQLNRKGKEAADKNGGVYRMDALSYSNEAERSADYITTTYLNDQHREAGTTLFCNLKNRDNPLFKPFLASMDFSCRRIQNFDPTKSTGSGMRVDTEDELNDLLENLNLKA